MKFIIVNASKLYVTVRRDEVRLDRDSSLDEQCESCGCPIFSDDNNVPIYNRGQVFCGGCGSAYPVHTE